MAVAGVPTFLDAPYAVDAAQNNFAGLDVVLVGVPMDLGLVTAQAHALARAPCAILNGLAHMNM